MANVITEEKEDVRLAFVETCEKISRYQGVDEPAMLVDTWQLRGSRVVAVWFIDGRNNNIKVDYQNGAYAVTASCQDPSEPQYEVVRRFRGGMLGPMAGHYIEQVARDIGLLA